MRSRASQVAQCLRSARDADAELLGEVAFVDRGERLGALAAVPGPAVVSCSACERRSTGEARRCVRPRFSSRSSRRTSRARSMPSSSATSACDRPRLAPITEQHRILRRPHIDAGQRPDEVLEHPDLDAAQEIAEMARPAPRDLEAFRRDRRRRSLGTAVLTRTKSCAPPRAARPQARPFSLLPSGRPWPASRGPPCGVTSPPGHIDVDGICCPEQQYCGPQGRRGLTPRLCRRRAHCLSGVNVRTIGHEQPRAVGRYAHREQGEPR